MRTSNIPPLFNHVFFFFLLSIGSSSSCRGSSHHTYNHHGTTQYWKGDVKNVAVQSAHVQYISINVCWASISSWKSEKKKKNCYSAIESIDIMHLAQTLIGLPFVPETLAQTFFLSWSPKKYRVPRLLSASNDFGRVYLEHFPLSARLRETFDSLCIYCILLAAAAFSVSVLYLMTYNN